MSAAGYLDVDGVRLEYRHWAGRIDGPTLVLLHEGLGCVELWQDFPFRLGDRVGLPVFAYSRAGYGRSDAAALSRPKRYMHDEALRTLPLVLAAAGIERSVLVGHSDGGSIAIVACSGEAQHHVEALVLMAAHVFIEDISLQGIRAAGDAFRDGSLRTRLGKYHGTGVDETFLGWHDAWLTPEFSNWNIEQYLPAVTVPALVLQGEQDEYGTPAQVEAIATGVRGPVRCCVLANCGHSPQRDVTSALLEEISNFLRTQGIA